MDYVQDPGAPYGTPIPICGTCRRGTEKNLRAIEEELKNEKRQSGVVVEIFFPTVAVIVLLGLAEWAIRSLARPE